MHYISYQGEPNKNLSPSLRIGLGLTNSYYVTKCQIVAGTAETRNAWKILVGKHERKRQLVRPKRRWEVTIKIRLRKIG